MRYSDHRLVPAVAMVMLIVALVSSGCGDRGAQRRAPISRQPMPDGAAGFLGVRGNGSVIWAIGSTPMLFSGVDEVPTSGGGVVKPDAHRVSDYRRDGTVRWRRRLPCQV